MIKIPSPWPRVLMFESKENRNKLVSRQKQHTGLFNFHPPFAFHQNISTRKSEDSLKVAYYSFMRVQEVYTINVQI